MGEHEEIHYKWKFLAPRVIRFLYLAGGKKIKTPTLTRVWMYGAILQFLPSRAHIIAVQNPVNVHSHLEDPPFHFIDGISMDNKAPIHGLNYLDLSKWIASLIHNWGYPIVQQTK
jgi:hypothetical protein